MLIYLLIPTVMGWHTSSVLSRKLIDVPLIDQSIVHLRVDYGDVIELNCPSGSDFTVRQASESEFIRCVHSTTKAVPIGKCNKDKVDRITIVVRKYNPTGGLELPPLGSAFLLGTNALGSCYGVKLTNGLVTHPLHSLHNDVVFVPIGENESANATDHIVEELTFRTFHGRVNSATSAHSHMTSVAIKSITAALWTLVHFATNMAVSDQVFATLNIHNGSAIDSSTSKFERIENRRTGSVHRWYAQSRGQKRLVVRHAYHFIENVTSEQDFTTEHYGVYLVVPPRYIGRAQKRTYTTSGYLSLTVTMAIHITLPFLFGTLALA